VVQDNWPVHKLPEVLQSLQNNDLTPLFLPTYASWLNQIEKLWRWLKQVVLHLHKLEDNLESLRTQVRNFLDSFIWGSDPLLRYVGLLLD
jgi:transposase